MQTLHCSTNTTGRYHHPTVVSGRPAWPRHWPRPARRQTGRSRTRPQAAPRPDGDGGAPGHGSKDAPTQSYGGEQALQCRVLVIAPSSIPFCGCALHLEPGTGGAGGRRTGLAGATRGRPGPRGGRYLKYRPPPGSKCRPRPPPGSPSAACRSAAASRPSTLPPWELPAAAKSCAHHGLRSLGSAGPMSVCTATHGRGSGGGAPAVRWAFARRAQCHRGFAGTASFSVAEGSMSERPRPWSPSSRRRVRWLLLDM
ncbi:hypothetical protein PVAP13_3KG016427 [Panicum virgatum]|uniref:Uncharacterized protein n=1 Tax=Panicum virgatum TaxID=38727 RepID=A0A8T0UP55_PANVG|nr:hypothetical protein PVAP13_3KG016427 [Panicum virgatum]